MKRSLQRSDDRDPGSAKVGRDPGDLFLGWPSRAWEAEYLPNIGCGVHVGYEDPQGKLTGCSCLSHDPSLPK